MSDPKFIWSAVTINHHVARLDGYSGPPVCDVVRPQKNRRDGSKSNWCIEVLHSRVYVTPVNADVRDLDSCKAEAERQTRDTIERLHEASRLRPKVAWSEKQRKAVQQVFEHDTAAPPRVRTQTAENLWLAAGREGGK